MSKDKVRILENVMGQIEMNGTIQYNYINEKGCKCAVGYVLDQCGVNMDILTEEYNNSDVIGDLFNKIKDIQEPLMDYGFTADELRELQKINDDYDDIDERSEACIKYIREMIKELK